jgi:hypothetical protein
MDLKVDGHPKEKIILSQIHKMQFTISSLKMYLLTPYRREIFHTTLTLEMQIGLSRLIIVNVFSAVLLF